MSIYKVYFKWKDKDVTLRARSLDLTHPYFVSIKDLVFPEGKKLIIDPAEDEIRKAFGDTDHLMIPFQSVSLIEENSEEKQKEKPKVRPFTLVDEEKGEEPPEK